MLAKKCEWPSSAPGTHVYCEAWARLLRSPEALPESLVQTMEELARQAEPDNWQQLEAAVYKARRDGRFIDISYSRENIALQLWLWAKEKEEAQQQSLNANPVPTPTGEDLQKDQQNGPLAVAKPNHASQTQTPEDPTPGCGASPLQGPTQNGVDHPSAKSVGKISRLPRAVREELNRRLQDEEEAKSILDWLHSLPEVQSVLAAEFGGRPISKQNLSEWKQHGFRDWQIRQSAIEFAQNLDADGTSLTESIKGPLSEKLAHWVALRYAAAANGLAALDSNPETELRRLRDFCRDIVALRRGDLYAGRLGVEQARLALEQGATEAQKQKEFWAWTEKPEIQAKLYPNRDPEQMRQEVIQMLDRELLGIKTGDEKEPPIDPAVLI